MNWYLQVLRKYAEFDGRARRKEYWFFTLFNVLVTMALMYLDFILGFMLNENVGALTAIYTLAVFLPSLAVTIRRLHDTNRSGWWFLISFIPLVGLIVMLIFTISDGDAGANKYGPDPKLNAS